MQQYAALIVQYLTDKGIPFELNRKEQSINMIFECDCGNTFSIFHYNEAEIISWSIFSWSIPVQRIEKVSGYLVEINAQMKSGVFYLDEYTGCVTYSLSHCPKRKSGAMNESLHQFCTKALSAVTIYQDSIHRVAFENTPVKELNN